MTGELTNSTKTISDFIALLPDYDKQKIVDLRQVEDAKPQEVDPVTNQIKDPKRPLVIIVQDWLNSQASGIRKYGGMLQSKPVEKPKCSECGKNHSGIFDCLALKSTISHTFCHLFWCERCS